MLATWYNFGRIPKEKGGEKKLGLENAKDGKLLYHLTELSNLELNKIAARWPAKAVAQFFLTFIKKQ